MYFDLSTSIMSTVRLGSRGYFVSTCKLPVVNLALSTPTRYVHAENRTQGALFIISLTDFDVTRGAWRRVAVLLMVIVSLLSTSRDSTGRAD